MRTTIPLLLTLALLPACWRTQELPLDPPDAEASDADGDSDSDSDSDTECSLDELPDMDDITECPQGTGWPCMCQNIEYCGSGAPCVGGLDFDMGTCVSFCQSEDPPQCPAAGPFGMDVVEVCGTFLDPEGCLCFLSGCEDYEVDCPDMGICIEPSCIDTYPGCVEGYGEVKVCAPWNY
jgi:hypothetical protein